MNYTIGEAAAKLGVTTHTLRYYDREGLLPLIARGPGGARLFGKEDFGRLRLIECLKTTGMPIKDIKVFIDWCAQGDATLQQRRQMFHERQRIVEAQMAELQQTLDTIRYKCWYYDTAVAAGTADVHRTMAPEDVPEEIRRMKPQEE